MRSTEPHLSEHLDLNDTVDAAEVLCSSGTRRYHGPGPAELDAAERSTGEVHGVPAPPAGVCA